MRAIKKRERIRERSDGSRGEDSAFDSLWLMFSLSPSPSLARGSMMSIGWVGFCLSREEEFLALSRVEGYPKTKLTELSFPTGILRFLLCKEISGCLCVESPKKMNVDSNQNKETAEAIRSRRWIQWRIESR